MNESATGESVAAIRDLESELWMVQAVIQPFKIDAVLLALEETPGISGLTVIECRGFGGQKLLDSDRGHGNEAGDDTPDTSQVVDFTSKLLLETVVAGRLRADDVISAIVTSAHTGRHGDGKVFAWPLARAISIRTREEQAKAL